MRRLTQRAGLGLCLLLGGVSRLAFTGDGIPPSLSLQLDQSWAGRTPAMGQVEQGSHGGALAPSDESAVYVTVRNFGHESDVLVAAQSVRALRVEIHDTVLRDGVMITQARPTVTIPAGGQLEMRPGQTHLRLIGLTHALRQGDIVPLTLTFQQMGQMTIEVVVR